MVCNYIIRVVFILIVEVYKWSIFFFKNNLCYDSHLISRHFLMIKLCTYVKPFVIIQKLEENNQF